jgi:hypothetical protein
MYCSCYSNTGVLQQSILKFMHFRRKSIVGEIITYIGVRDELELFHKDPPLVMRHQPVKSSSFLWLTFSSSKLDESSLEKLKLLRAVHARDMIFLTFFFLSPRRFFFL